MVNIVIFVSPATLCAAIHMDHSEAPESKGVFENKPAQAKLRRWPAVAVGAYADFIRADLSGWLNPCGPCAPTPGIQRICYRCRL
jgi:hypothetical protein